MLVQNICELFNRARKACPVGCVVVLVPLEKTESFHVDAFVIEWSFKVAGQKYTYSVRIDRGTTEEQIEWMFSDAKATMRNKINAIGGKDERH